VADSQDFLPVSENQWAAIKEAVQQNAGITIDSDNGEASKDGVKLGWAYTANDEKLTVTPEGRAWYDPSEATIDAKLKAWIQAAMGL
jgi:hypothetical protein